MYLTRTQTTGPKMKSCSSVGTSVNGMQKTLSSRSAMLRFSSRTFVSVRIRRFCAIVSATSAFPETDRTKMATYRPMRNSTCIPLPTPAGKVPLFCVALTHVELSASAILSLRNINNPLMGTGNYNATSNNMKSVHWPLMGGLLHLVQQGGDWAKPQPAQAPPRCTKCNSPSINGNHYCCILVRCSAGLMCPRKG